MERLISEEKASNVRHMPRKAFRETLGIIKPFKYNFYAIDFAFHAVLAIVSDYFNYGFAA
ncbi:MAG TPA: hypothetical protein ENG54_03505 [Thermofilum sp.]|nr:hypothetical protein [Thermoproteales archaeon]HDJ97511.1 hypothetical protein [Thermofilum sp.]